MQNRNSTLLGMGIMLVVGAAVVPLARGKSPKEQKPSGEQEKKVAEAEVPKTALEALKKLAGSAAITEYAEEIEHGHKFYEGSWKGATGKIDALVTESGALVEIEETVPADTVPTVVREATVKHAGKESVRFEKKTMVLYEMHFKQAGKAHEMVMTPDGREYHEDGDKPGEKEEDDDKD